MTDAGTGKLHIDSDWKAEAAKEKDRLADQERAAPKDAAAPGAANFIEILNILAMQAAVSLGGYQGAGGERLPPNPMAAKHFIDLIDVLDQKTRGNLNETEKKVLDSVLYEMRMQYVQMVSAAMAPPRPGKQ